jgi:hypothetical protein
MTARYRNFGDSARPKLAVSDPILFSAQNQQIHGRGSRDFAASLPSAALPQDRRTEARMTRLPYKSRTIVRPRKNGRKTAIAKSEAKPPEIFVRVATGDWRGSSYARAHIRVKAGGYQYLQWRENDRVRSLYLGKKRKS